MSRSDIERNFVRERRANWILAAIGTVLLTMVATVAAQEGDEQKGVEQDNYNIKQSVEFGGRISSISGDPGTFDTVVNLRQGLRLLDFTTEMRSLNHHGTLFDNLYLSNFGYGGDPETVSQLRLGKNRWYNFSA